LTLALISHPACLLHDMGDWHPESPARLNAIQDALVSAGLDFAVRQIDAPLATREQLERVHDPAYLDLVEATAPSEGHALLDHETRMNPHSHEAALRAAGAVVAAVDLVMAGEVEVAFCSVRPPGHHAERARSMGFCIYNNVAVGAAHALAAHGLERVAIIDFDVHHGNGTEDIFRDEPRVLLCSSFQHPFYPNLGAETELPHILNLPLPAGTGGEAYRKAVENLWPEALDAFRPQLIFFSAGFDAHAADDMSQLRLTEADYRWITDMVRWAANAHAQGRIVSTLEGGYALHALGRSVAAHIDALLGQGWRCVYC
jgi:acetoin utilization deacetylase AcuC-like enzyme